MRSTSRRKVKRSRESSSALQTQAETDLASEPPQQYQAVEETNSQLAVLEEITTKREARLNELRERRRLQGGIHDGSMRVQSDAAGVTRDISAKAAGNVVSLPCSSTCSSIVVAVPILY